MGAPNQNTETSRITFELLTQPALGVEELENFHRLAESKNKTVPEMMVGLIREALATAEAQEAA